jgi:hypothetical protein
MQEHTPSRSVYLLESSLFLENKFRENKFWKSELF